jgi:hypothetical protein
LLNDSECNYRNDFTFGELGATYVQVKSSTKPSGKNAILVDDAPWTELQLFRRAPIYNRRRDGFQAGIVLIVASAKTGEQSFYLVPTGELWKIALKVGRRFAKKPKLDGGTRKMFRKEVPSSMLKKWRDAWFLLGDPFDA